MFDSIRQGQDLKLDAAGLLVGVASYQLVDRTDPAKLPYAKLLEVFWRNIDPTQGNGQFCDHGPQYRSAVFPATPEERKAAEASLAAAGKTLGRPIVTQILASGPFWPAETYHQDFYKKNPDHYHAYREGCGRDRRLQQLWGESAGH